MSTSHVNTPPLTVKDYRALPENGPRYQLIEGDLYMSPSPNRFHQEILGNLFVILRSYVLKHKLGNAYMAPFDVYLNLFNAFQPDILFVARSSYPILTKAGASGSPDLIIEILSPSTKRLDLRFKRRVYEKHKVKEIWYIDPEKRQIEVQRLQGKTYDKPFVVADDTQISTPLIPGLEIPLADIFFCPTDEAEDQ